MIELRKIRASYAEVPVLAGIDLVINEADVVLLCGPTGSGKSTLLGILTGLMPRFTGGALAGDLLFDGESLMDLPPRDRAHLIGYVAQNPVAGFVTDTVEEELAYGMEQLGLDATTMRRRVEETLDLLGIADLRARDLSTLSGGQQQRVAIGAVLTMHPRLLVLDEPTSALDPTAAEEVLATITRLAHDVGVSIVLAEHRLERVVPYVDEMVILDGSGHATVGPPRELLATSPLQPPLVELANLCGWDPLPLTIREGRRHARTLDIRPTGTQDGPIESRSTAPSVSVRDLVVQHGAIPALRGVNLDLHPGDVTALMGRNGAGKSSLLWAIQGSGPRRSGSVLISGGDPQTLPASRRRDQVGMVPQSPADLLYLDSVAQECAAADRAADAAAGACAALLAKLVPDVRPEAHPRDLSEGQRLALVLSIVLTGAPPVVLLDEPTRGLDYPGKESLAQLIAELALQGHTIVVATHDVEFAAVIANRAVVLADGEVVSSGRAAAVLAESPSFAPQITKVLGADWLTVDDVRRAMS